MQERLCSGGDDSIKVNLREVVCEGMNALSVANTVSYRAAKPMSRVPKMISLARSIHCYSNFFYFFCPISVSVL